MPPPQRLIVDLLDWWHIGTGEGLGGFADAAAARDPGTGLPYIPGRTIRGLVRDAVATAEDAGRLRPGLTQWIFGTALPPTAATQTTGAATETEVANLRRDRFETEHGAGIFGSAELPAAWRQWAANCPESRSIVDALFDTVAATAIDDDGLAAHHTLRRIEVAAPMTLEAPLTWRPTEADPPVTDIEVRDALATALPLIRGLGKGRNRGLGRCRMRLIPAAEEVA